MSDVNLHTCEKAAAGFKRKGECKQCLKEKRDKALFESFPEASPTYQFKTDPPKSDATFFKEEVEALLNGRYKNMSVYQTVGALEVVKTNLLERLGRMGGGQ